MSSNTNFLDLLMKDPVADKDDTFNIETMLNENWRKIDALLGMLAGHGNDLVKLSPAAKYMEHWWYRQRIAGSYPIVMGERCAPTSGDNRYWIYSSNDGGDREVVYAEAVEVGEDGTIHLVSPEKLTVSQGTFETSGLPELIRGKYVRRGNSDTYKSLGPMYIPEDALFSLYYGGSNQPNRWYPSVACDPSVGVPEVREWELLRSDDRATYPDSGVHDNYEYRYAGIPMESTTPLKKIVYGTYVGTGADSEYNPITLVFDREPIMLIVGAGSRPRALDEDSAFMHLIPLWTTEFVSGSFFGLAGSAGGYGRKRDGGKIIEWYANSESSYHFNGAGKRYCYVALFE